MLESVELKQCLALLGEADAILMEAGEIALAAHLSLVIERLKQQAEA